jgi:eukaryotic-like serine/threonine-protein kinase
MSTQASPPQVVGSYELLEKIHEGGMGEIYRARHRFLLHLCVVKAIRTQLGSSGDLEARFLQEARTAKHLRHPNIAEVYDFFVAADLPYIVMELIPGRSLHDLLQAHGPPPLELTLEIAAQALRALGFLHDHHFVHRDVSPDNLMLTADGEGRPLLKLIDLGLVKSLEATQQLTEKGTFLGKLRYAAPEQFGDDHATVDARSDLYSFGVVLYLLLTQVLPIDGQTQASIISGHLLRPPRPFAESDPYGRVPERLRSCVLKALAKRQEDRHQTAADFAAELDRCRADLAAGPGPTVVMESAWHAAAAPVGNSPAQPRSGWPATAGKDPAPRGPAGSRPAVPSALLALSGTISNMTQHLLRSPVSWLTFGALAVLVVLLAIGGRLREPKFVPTQPAAATAPALQPKAAAAASPLPPGAGTAPAPREVAVDASPWAEVVGVVRQDGTPVALGPQRFTPLVLLLAPGAYRITLAHDASTRTEEIVVPPDTRAPSPHLRVRFPSLDADAFLDADLSRAKPRGR